MAIGAIAAAIAGIVQAAATAGAARDANALNWQNLAFQKENARKQYGLATAERPDVYGNVTSFDDILKKWNIKLTPAQERLIRAGEREQTLSLTEDAPRARGLRRRQEVRSKTAEEDARRATDRYRYEEPASEGAQEAEGVADAIMARGGRLGEGVGTLSRAALRLNQGDLLPQIVREAANQAGGSLGEDIVRGKDRGRANYRASTSAHANKFLPAIRQFIGTADDIGGAPTRFSETPGQMGQTIESMLRAISGALTNEGTQVGSAYSDLAAGVRSGVPDFSGIISALSGIGGGGSSGPDTFSASQVRPLFGPSAPTGLGLEDRVVPEEIRWPNFPGMRGHY